MVTVNNPTGTVMAIPERAPGIVIVRDARLFTRAARLVSARDFGDGRCVIIDIPFYPAPDAYRRRLFFAGHGKRAANGDRKRHGCRMCSYVNNTRLLSSRRFRSSRFQHALPLSSFLLEILESFF